MADTRDYKSLGVVAKDALAVTEGDGKTRTQGTAYKNVNFSTLQQLAGKGFNNRPTSENVNRQIENMSKFTDFVDSGGILGWKADITYNIGALVRASDGLVYQSLRDGMTSVDPIDDDQDPPYSWQELADFTQAAIDLSSTTPGDEGALQVGTYNKYRHPVGGSTLQKSLEENAEQLYPMRNMNIVASANFDWGQPYSALIFPKRDNYNIASATLMPNAKNLFGKQVIGYITINFINPIPTDSVVMLNNNSLRYFVFSGGKTVYHSTSTGYAEFDGASIKIGVMVVQQINNLIPTWGFEDPESRVRWQNRLVIYTVDP